MLEQLDKINTRLQAHHSRNTQQQQLRSRGPLSTVDTQTGSVSAFKLHRSKQSRTEGGDMGTVYNLMLKPEISSNDTLLQTYNARTL